MSFSGASTRQNLACPVLIIAITHMLLISIQPFALKRIFFLVATLLYLSSAICFADSLFMTSRSTPYGRQLNRIESRSVPKRAVRPLFGLETALDWQGNKRKSPESIGA